MKDPLVKGHPLHAMLSDLPVGTTVAGVVFDILASATRSEHWRFAATASFGTAFLSGGLAALVGFWDYQSVPPDHPARRTGALHGYLNAGALVLLGLTVATRTSEKTARAAGAADRPPSRASRLLPLLVLTLLTASGWLGGELVFKLGWRVLPAEHAEKLEADLRRSGDQLRIDKAHTAVLEYEHSHALVP
ncbi:MAG: DUF2231 domain-containing protein [Chloroflexota bacterium]